MKFPGCCQTANPLLVVMGRDVLIRSPNDVTTAWAQRVVDGQMPGVKVGRVDITSIDVGTTTRIRLQVSHDGPDSLPSHWFVKLPSLNWRARAITALPRLLAREIYFYNSLAKELPVKMPTPLAAQNSGFKGSALVLADLKHSGAVPGRSDDSLTVLQARNMLGQLAGLHAQYWGKTQIDPRYDWLGHSVRRTENRLATVMAVPLMEMGFRRAGQSVPPSLRPSALMYARYRDEATRLLTDGTQTLVHYDCHPGNLFWRQAEPGLLDWQLVRSGEGIGDVAYCLATALAPEIRRRHEQELLGHYHQMLLEQGVDLSFERLLERYRLHLVYPFEAMLVTLAIGGMMDEQTNLMLIERASSAVLDWDSLAAVIENLQLKPARWLLGKRFSVNS